MRNHMLEAKMGFPRLIHFRRILHSWRAINFAIKVFKQPLTRQNRNETRNNYETNRNETRYNLDWVTCGKVRSCWSDKIENRHEVHPMLWQSETYVDSEHETSLGSYREHMVNFLEEKYTTGSSSLFTNADNKKNPQRES